jgi:hypothetical protein
MPVYTVHGPISDTARPSPDRIAFVRDGFAIWAFVFGPLWLIWHRLWWALLGYVGVMAVAMLAMAAFNLPADARLLISLLMGLLMGLEAASLRRWTLSRRKWRQLDVVVADDRDAAERRFFDRWTGTPLYIEPQDPGAPPPARNPAIYAAPAREDIIGLFPQPGVPR